MKQWWFEIEWWWADSFEGFGESLCMCAFWAVGIVALLFMSPIIVLVGIVYLLYYLCLNGKALVLGLFEWIRDKVAITLVCTLAGLLLGICGGATGAAGGAAFGFFVGVVLEMIRWTDGVGNYTGNNPNKSGNWLGLPYDDGNYNAPPAYNGGRVRVTNYYEKPWIWKGFQVREGPREDQLRRDV